MKRKDEPKESGLKKIIENLPKAVFHPRGVREVLLGKDYLFEINPTQSVPKLFFLALVDTGKYLPYAAALVWGYDKFFR